METRTYSQTEVNEIVRRYNRGDIQAGKVVDCLARSYQTDHGVSYQEAIRAICCQPRSNSSTVKVPLQNRHDAGVRLDHIARSIMASENVPDASGQPYARRLSYSESLKLACARYPNLAQEYLSGRTADNYIHENRGATQLYDDKRTKRAVGALAQVVGCQRTEGGTVDWEAGLLAAKTLPANVIEDAARNRLAHLARLHVVMFSRPGPMSDHMPEAIKQLRQENPELAALADDGSSLTVETLREVLKHIH